MIRYLERKAIDTKSWDATIGKSGGTGFYACSWYLDASAENWSALVDDDYRFVMPLTWKKKLGIRYLYTPLFTQQLGVFGKELVPPDVVHDFLHAIPKSFRFGDLQFNTGNLLGDEDGYEVNDRLNYELSTARNYHELYGAYSENNKRNLKKAFASGVELRYDLGVSEIVHFKRDLAAIKLPEEYYLHIRDLFSTLAEHGKNVIISAHLNGKICAAALFGISGKRAVYLYSASNEEGKEARAMFMIIDQFIRDFEEQEYILDFEGSSIPSIARFFAGFGAKACIYQQVSFNRLPLNLKKLKGHGLAV